MIIHEIRLLDIITKVTLPRMCSTIQVMNGNQHKVLANMEKNTGLSVVLTWYMF